MDIQVRTENGSVPVTVMQVNGNLDSNSYESFEKQVSEQIENGARYILMDFSNCKFISSAGFRALNKIFKQLRQVHPDTNVTEADMKQGIRAGTYKSPHLKLLNLSPESRSVFEMSGFDMYLDTFSSLDTALASF